MLGGLISQIGDCCGKCNFYEHDHAIVCMLILIISKCYAHFHCCAYQHEQKIRRKANTDYWLTFHGFDKLSQSC